MMGSQPTSAKAGLGLVIVNHINSTLGTQLKAHASHPTVITPPDGTPRWQLPAETEVLITTPKGWAGAPAEKPDNWPRNLRWIQTESVGIDAYPRWIFEGATVTSSKGSNAPALAEYVMTAILLHEKRFDRISVKGPEDWQHIPMGSVEGKALGIAGFGFVGQAITRLARAFNMRVRAFRRTAWDGNNEGVEPVGSIGELFEASDHLVLAMPATPLTRNIIDRAVLGRAKPGLHLINVARGDLVDQDALLEALDEKRIAGAVLDVTSPEPLPEGHRLYSHPKVRLTPHVAWEGFGNAVRFDSIVLRNMDAFVAGRDLENMVDPAKGY
jgi:phosphoglycerate dehydrogenase-like enzyme